MVYKIKKSLEYGHYNLKLGCNIFHCYKLTNRVKLAKKEKVVLITGAASGIGKAISMYLKSKEYFVIGADMNSNALESLRECNINTICFDLTDEFSINKAYQEIKSTFDGIECIINNAGIFDQIPMVEGDIQRFEKLINVNVLGAFRVTNIFFPLLHKEKGRVINISSETAKALLPFQTYGSSKYMMEAWSNTLRMELKLLGMHVILIHAGGHKTPLMRKTLDVLDNIQEDSIFKDALNKVKEEGGRRILSVDKDPTDVAKVVYKAINDRNPKRIYSVNESTLYKFIAILPRGIKESLVLGALNRK